jgi:hypothetical protein
LSVSNLGEDYIVVQKSGMSDERRTDRLYRRALEIREAHAHGFWVPIMQHLALRGHVEAMVDLADWYSGSDGNSLGIASDSFSAAGLCRRAYRKGDARAARNLALGCFNNNDLPGYRQWMRRAGQAGDVDSVMEARRFETRLWHGAARKIGRGRPWHKRDDFM